LICRLCEKERGSDFYKGRKVCKPCYRGRAREYQEAHKDKALAWKSRNKDRISGYEQTRDKEKISARGKLRYAVKVGKVKKPIICEGCKDLAPLEGHHDDYSKPLEVRWVCKKCHGLLHRKDLP